MRHVVCRFRHIAELRDHLVYSPHAFGPPRALQFLGAFEVEPGERVAVTMECEESGARCQVIVTVGAHLAHRSEALWHYLGRFEEGDRVWVEMMLAKSQTIARFRAA